jgi:type I restriction enzyme S subunit
VNVENAPSRAQRLIKRGDVLFQLVRPYQQNNLFFVDEGEYVASTGYAMIRTANNPKFLYQYIHTQAFLNEVLIRCTGTSYPAITSNELSDISIKWPNHREQKKIADFLSSIDNKINKVSTQLQKTKAFKKGLLQQMFV